MQKACCLNYSTSQLFKRLTTKDLLNSFLRERLVNIGEQSQQPNLHESHGTEEEQRRNFSGII
jgi:hypothetical protein